MNDLDRPLGISDNPIVTMPLQVLQSLQALADKRLELARVVDRHRKDRMHSDMKLGWEMAQKILKEAKELSNE